jgi:hypothetical protein
MLKDLFDKGKCALGFHADAWRYARQGSCAQTSTCRRCQAVSRRVHHDWPDGWSLVSPQGCEVARRCRRCPEQEITVEHRWGPTAYRADGSCEQVQPCVRCGAEKEAAAVHLWTEWTYDAGESCAQTLRCARCNAAGGSSRVSHEWSRWQQSAFYEAQVQVCGRCAEMVFDLDPADDDGVPLSMQRAAATVARISADAEDPAAFREAVLAHRREMLSPVTDRYLRFAIEHYAAEPPKRDPLTALAALLERCRSQGADAVLRPAAIVPPPLPASATGTGQAFAASPSTDIALVGHWRHTESFASGGVSLVTDTHLLLTASGRFERWSKSAGSMGSTQSARDAGNWSVVSGSLRLAFDDGRRDHFRFDLSGDSMLCPDETRYRLWRRIS